MKLSIRLAQLMSCTLFLCLACAQASASTLSYVSEYGDYIGQGQTKSFSQDANNPLTNFHSASTFDNRSVRIYFRAANSFDYQLDMVAPLGQKLVPGVYNNAVRAFQDDSTNGLDFAGENRGCNRITGSFTVYEAVYGPYGYIQTFHASWEQHCEGRAPALFGEVYISNPPSMPALTMEVTLDTNVKVTPSNGNVVLAGTMKCNQEVSTLVFVDLLQTKAPNNFAYAGDAYDVPCHTTTSRWSIEVSPFEGTSKFKPGTAQLNTVVMATDPNYDQPAEVRNSAALQLSPPN